MDDDLDSNVVQMPRGGVSKRCIAMTQMGRGPRCSKPAITGSTVCRTHGGGTPAVQRKAIVRRELENWGLNGIEETVDPGQTLLRLLTQSYHRANFYGEILRQSWEVAAQNGNQSEFDMPNGVRGLIDRKYIQGENGSIYVGDAIKAIVVLEKEERDRCASLSLKALAAGLAERQVKLLEMEASLVVGAVKAALDRAGVQGPARLEALDVASTFLLESSG